MAIRVQHGEVGTIAKLSKLAGESVAARRDYERRQELIQRAQEMQQQEELARFEMEQRAEMRKQEIAASTQEQQVSRQWEIEKMVMRSQQDFAMQAMRDQAFAEQELQRDLQKKAKFDNLIDLIEEKRRRGELNDNQYNQAIINAHSQHGIGAKVLPTTSGAGYGVKPWYEDPTTAFNPRAHVARQKAMETDRFGSKPWYLNPAIIDTPEAIAAQEEAGIFRDAAPLEEEDVRGMSIEELEKLAGGM